MIEMNKRTTVIRACAQKKHIYIFLRVSRDEPEGRPLHPAIIPGA